MKGLLPYTINVRGQLLNLSKPQVMGILNVTPDSFYAGSRMETEDAIRKRVRQIADEGGGMIDVGAYSSRPGAADVSSKEEMERLRRGMKIVREECPVVIFIIFKLYPFSMLIINKSLEESDYK